jgi:amino acid adenylation domain-containing protein
VWTYAEMDEAADTMARNLLARIEPGARVAVCLPRGADMVLSFIAILKAGATYVPLDPKHPADRLGYIVEDADAALVITDNVAAFGEQPCIDPAELRKAAIPLPPADPARLAYLIYTSGSTGRPKGALIAHEGLLNHLRAFAKEPGLGAGDRFLAVTTVGFDISILEMLLPLIVGATAVLADQEILLSPAELAKVLEEGRITHMQATPASWRMLLDAGWEGKPGLVSLIGGEALDAQLAQRLMDKTGTLWNLYGPTETTIWSSAMKVEPHHARAGKVPIGGPSDNTHFHILDAYMQPVPEGVPGELCIGGMGLGQGYWQRPGLSAEKFVPNPFYDPGNPSLRLYRTGDVVNRRAGGELEFIGRTDFQIKLRGYRIEVGEIESLLHEEPAVAHAVVLLDEKHERLVAYCRLEAPLEPAEKTELERDLRRSLADRLPRYMVPGAFVLMDEFPLNTNGKVDRKRLPAPEAPRTGATASAPRNEIERTLLGVWQEVLKRQDIGVEDNFFDLGGDSVIAIQIIARAQSRGLAIDPLQMFEHQTVVAQAQIARPVEPALAVPAPALPVDAASAAKVDKLLARLKQRNG